MNRTKIDYLDFSWNVTPGCTHGCLWCWARAILKRQKHRCRKCYDFVPHLHPERLGEPAARRKPAIIGVSFTGDLFDPAMSDPEPEFICQGPRDRRVFRAMEAAPWHTYVILTKQPKQAVRRLLSWTERPQANWWLLTSVTNRADADKRIPEILKLKEYGWPVVGVSIEPLLGPVDISRWLLDWVIIGAQTGPGAVAPEAQWVSEILRYCRWANIPVFVKDNVGWPDVIREFPV